MVRRIPRLLLLLPAARSGHRPFQRGGQLRHRLQTGHDPGEPPPARVRLGVRPDGRPAGPGPGLPGRRHAPVPVRAQLHHLRREPAVDHGRRVLVLAQLVAVAALPGCRGLGPPHRPSPRPGGRALCRHPAVPPDPGPVRRGRRGGLAAPRRRHPTDGVRWAPGGGRRPAVGAPAGLVRGGRRPRLRPGRMVAPALRGRAAVHHQHGLHQGLRLPPPALPGIGPLGADRRRGGGGGHGGPPQPGGPVPRGDGWGVGRGDDRRPGVQALRRTVPAALVPVHVPARRVRAGRGRLVRGPVVASAPAERVGPGRPSQPRRGRSGVVGPGHPGYEVPPTRARRGVRRRGGRSPGGARRRLPRGGAPAGAAGDDPGQGRRDGGRQPAQRAGRRGTTRATRTSRTTPSSTR